MMSFVDFFKVSQLEEKPWLIFGQGPTFSKHKEYSDLDRKFLTMGLNRVARSRKVFVTHAVDLHVLDDIPDLPRRTEYLVMPWTPHVKWKSSFTTLDDLIESNDAIRQMNQRGRLLWYNLSTSKIDPKPGSPVVGVTWFSSEAAIHLLSLCGVKQIRTLGIDGGNQLASEFSFMKPLKAGHRTYSLQDSEIKKLVRRYGLDFGPLGG